MPNSAKFIANQKADRKVSVSAYCGYSKLPKEIMTLCPIAVVAGCEKCPAFKICPLKGVLGDQAKPAAAPAPDQAKKK